MLETKGTCDYLTVGGIRVPSRNVRLTVTETDGTKVRTYQVYISTMSKGQKFTEKYFTKDGFNTAFYRDQAEPDLTKDRDAHVAPYAALHTTPSKLKKLLKNNPGMSVTAQVFMNRKRTAAEGQAAAAGHPTRRPETAVMSFDPSRCRGKDVDGTATIDTAWSAVSDELWDVALQGISYGDYKGNVRQMKWLIENGRGVAGIREACAVSHESAENVTKGLLDYAEEYSVPSSLSAILTEDTIARQQALGYSAQKQKNATAKTYKIGDVGPAGGIIFSVESGMYLEAASEDRVGQFSWKEAMAAAQNYKHNGFSDWYLPSLHELSAMYNNRDRIGGFSAVFYWSSSEDDASYAWYQSFSSGNQGNCFKYFTYYVRPVRAFSI